MLFAKNLLILKLTADWGGGGGGMLFSGFYAVFAPMVTHLISGTLKYFSKWCSIVITFAETHESGVFEESKRSV